MSIGIGDVLTMMMWAKRMKRMKSIAMGWGIYLYKESTDERQTKTSKSGESSSDLAVEDVG
jgi:hypothetical protein